jgi:hypothetical protein
MPDMTTRKTVEGEGGLHRDGAKPAMAKYFHWPLLLGAGTVWAQNNAVTKEYPEGKYPDAEGRPNFMGGIQHTKLADSILRHLLAWLRGEDGDPESGLPHLWHLQCCLSMLAWMVDNRPDLDDRPGMAEVQACRDVVEDMIEAAERLMA